MVGGESVRDPPQLGCARDPGVRVGSRMPRGGVLKVPLGWPCDLFLRPFLTKVPQDKNTK